MKGHCDDALAIDVSKRVYAGHGPPGHDGTVVARGARVARRNRPAMGAMVRRSVLGISLDQATFQRRGFHPGTLGRRAHLEQIGLTFLHGYNLAITHGRPEPLAELLMSVPNNSRGFAFEGAAMGLTILDCLTPWQRDRFNRFLCGPAGAHTYMAHVGVGWACARLRRPVDRAPVHLDPLFRWLALDGYGFHQGYFHPRRFIDRQVPARELSGYARRAFDQGLGRSLWFVLCADIRRIGEAIARFAAGRRPDLWSGVGLACAYAGGVDTPTIAALAAAGSSYASDLAQGAAFAAAARLRAGNLVEHTALACEILCGMPAVDAAAVTEQARVGLPSTSATPAFETWRRRIASRFGAPKPEVTS
jgi:enediyne biosynthesis protein E3